MDVQTKVILTTIAMAVGIGILLLSKRADNAGPTSMWRLGRLDPVRNVLFRADGSLRRFTKATGLLLILIWLLMLWIIVPTGRSAH
jgi:hypothetical protein